MNKPTRAESKIVHSVGADASMNLSYTKLGCDSHADISCAGKDALIVEYISGKRCTVHAYNETYAPKEDVKLCNVLFSFDTTDGKTYLLRVNQCLNFY